MTKVGRTVSRSSTETQTCRLRKLLPGSHEPMLAHAPLANSARNSHATMQSLQVMPAIDMLAATRTGGSMLLDAKLPKHVIFGPTRTPNPPKELSQV